MKLYNQLQQLSIFDIVWQSIGGILGLLVGRQAIVITLKQRKLSLDSGLNWPWEWADSIVFRWWAVGLGFGFFFVILFFGWAGALLGFVIGMPPGYLLRNVWKIDEAMPTFQTDEYAGD